MRTMARTIAAAALLGTLVIAPAPQVGSGDPDRLSGSGGRAEFRASAGEMRAALGQMRVHADREEIGRILDAVGHHAERFDLDPVMVLAVIHVESRFDSRAVSPKGAMGLMQLRPETAREVASALDLDWTDSERLFDPDFNILLGTCYLRSLLDRFDDRDTALAAYHAGPTRVSAIRRQAGTLPLRYTERVSEAFSHLAAL
jgi:soluble lytic murein transglycosylase-like protein